MSHTGNPRHPNNPPSDYPQEPTGPVAQDSLANDSIRASGGFSENTNPEVLGVKGYQSTLTNTDTSNAETLPPASSSAAREQAEHRGLGSDERGTAGGLRYPDDAANQTSSYGGTTSDQGYRGGSGDASLSGPAGSSYTSREPYSTSNPGAFDDTPSSASGGYDPNISSSGTSHAHAQTGGARPYVDSAPNYAGTDNFRSAGTYKPAGDATEDTAGDIPENMGTYTGDVGGPKDPGRLAEQTFQKSAGDSSAGEVRDYSDTAADGNPYDELRSSERA